MVLSQSSEYARYYSKEIETMDRERLATLQLDRLEWQVKRCYESSEFYRERFDRVGLKPEDISSLDDVLNIPPVTKQELRDEQLSHPPFWPICSRPQKGLERTSSIHRDNRGPCEYDLDRKGCGKHYPVDN